MICDTCQGQGELAKCGECGCVYIPVLTSCFNGCDADDPTTKPCPACDGYGEVGGAPKPPRESLDAHDAAIRADERERIAAAMERRAQKLAAGNAVLQVAATELESLAALIREGRE